MKMRILLSILFCSLFSISLTGHSAIIPASNPSMIPSGSFYEKIASLRIKDIQKSIGRKLTLKEKIALLILKQKLRHAAKDPLLEGDIALIFGIAGLVFLALFFLLPYFMILSIASAIVAIVSGHKLLKNDPTNKKAKTAKLLGWISLGLVVVGFIIILIAFASIGSWSFG